jgi:hypothetical protein
MELPLPVRLEVLVLRNEPNTHQTTHARCHVDECSQINKDRIIYCVDDQELLAKLLEYQRTAENRVVWRSRPNKTKPGSGKDFVDQERQKVSNSVKCQSPHRTVDGNGRFVGDEVTGKHVSEFQRSDRSFGNAAVADLNLFRSARGARENVPCVRS